MDNYEEESKKIEDDTKVSSVTGVDISAGSTRHFLGTFVATSVPMKTKTYRREILGE